MFYFYDGDIDESFRGYRSLAGTVKDAMVYVKAHPRAYVCVYQESRILGTWLGRVYIGKHNGKSVLKFKTERGTYMLNKDGTIKD